MHMPGTMQAAKRIAEIDAEKATLKAALKKLDEERAGLEEAIIEEWIDENIHKLTVGDRTVYVHKQLWATPVKGAGESAVGKLLEMGHADALMASTQRLSAMVRVDEGFGELLESTGVFTIENRLAIRTRKA